MSHSVVTETAMSSAALLDHWQGHRRLTRRVIDAFPEDQLFSFSLGGMRPFGALVMELLAMAAPMVRGVALDEWAPLAMAGATPKAEILRQWDEATRAIDELWPRLTAARFEEQATAFGEYPGKVLNLLLYTIDNEVHHRGQGYVYLRALGVEPPPFFER